MVSPQIDVIIYACFSIFCWNYKFYCLNYLQNDQISVLIYSGIVFYVFSFIMTNITLPFQVKGKDLILI